MLGLRDLIEKQGGFVTLDLISGRQAVSGSLLSNSVQIHPGSAGQVYFGQAADNQYRVLKLDWKGPKYRRVTIIKSSEKEKMSAKGRLKGALIGTLIAPGVGTIIGGLKGTKKGRQNVRHAEAHTEPEELDVPARLTLENAQSGQRIYIEFHCNSELHAKLLNSLPALSALSDRPAGRKTAGDPMDEILKLKKLLDAGAVTQEEYDAKKKQLLGL